jgi:superoxide reductase
MSKSGTRFFICEHCGNIIGLIHDAGVPIICCGDEMKEMVAGSVDASKEKHVPAVAVEGDVVTVKVGSEAHPMIAAHYIEWVYLQTERGGQRKNLNPGEEPTAVFALTGDKPVAAYAYCNLHGLWKADI